MQAQLLAARGFLAGGVMQLLSQMYSKGAQQAPANGTLSTLVPRLWPCFRHALAVVRLAAVRCLSVLVPDSTAQQPSWLAGEQLTTAMQLAFQNLVMEADDGIRQASQQLWSRLLHAADSTQLAAIPEPCLQVRCMRLLSAGC